MSPTRLQSQPIDIIDSDTLDYILRYLTINQASRLSLAGSASMHNVIKDYIKKFSIMATPTLNELDRKEIHDVRFNITSQYQTLSINGIVFKRTYDNKWLQKPTDRDSLILDLYKPIITVRTSFRPEFTDIMKYYENDNLVEKFAALCQEVLSIREGFGTGWSSFKFFSREKKSSEGSDGREAAICFKSNDNYFKMIVRINDASTRKNVSISYKWTLDINGLLDGFIITIKKGQVVVYELKHGIDANNIFENKGKNSVYEFKTSDNFSTKSMKLIDVDVINELLVIHNEYDGEISAVLRENVSNALKRVIDAAYPS